MGSTTKPLGYFPFYHGPKRHWAEPLLKIGAGLAILGILWKILRLVRQHIFHIPARGFFAFMGFLGWLLPVLAGGALIAFVYFYPPRYRALTLFSTGFALAHRQGKQNYSYAQIKSITEMKTKQGHRVVEIALENEEASLAWSSNDLGGYQACISQLEALSWEFFANEQLPENLNTLSVNLAEGLLFSGGMLHWLGNAIAPAEIEGYIALPFEERIAAKPEIVVTLRDGATISLPPERILKRSLLLYLLEEWGAAGAVLNPAAPEPVTGAGLNPAAPESTGEL